MDKTDVITLAGVVLIVVGVGLIYRPAAFIIAGIFMLAYGYLDTFVRPAPKKVSE